VKSDEVEGRVIHLTFDVTLTPEQTGHLGDTDAAWDYGNGLIRDVFTLLRNVGEAEGFKVEVRSNEVVY
jgi:hypothetical protein